MIPGGGMKCWPCKALDAFQLGILRDVQASDTGDEYTRADAHSLTSGGMPHAFGLIPDCFVKTRIQPDVRRKFVTLDAAFQIIVNFLLAGVHARPIRRRLERKGIEMRRNVAGAAGIAVVVPGSADVVALLEQQERNSFPLRAA